MPITRATLNKASSSYQKGGDKYEAGENANTTRYTKKKFLGVRRVNNIIDTTDTEGREMDPNYEYKLASDTIPARKKSGGMYKSGGVIDSVMKKYKKKK